MNDTTRIGRAAIDMTGQRIKMLTVLHRAETKGKGAMWVCKCDCGTVKAIRRGDLIHPQKVSCGCYNRTKAITHGRSGTKAYFRWKSMIDRCHNPKSKSYWMYGARGVSVCQEWRDSFAKFLADVGECPPGMTLDRIDTFGNYEPGNVRWATYKQQARNTRRNHLHTINGETKCLAEWCEILNEPWTTVKKRLAEGRDPFYRFKKRRSDAKQQ